MLEETKVSNISGLINDFGFPIFMAVGMGYFIYYVWRYITLIVKPELDKMRVALIKVIDQTRMLDNDMIRLQQKVNVVLEYREQAKLKEEGKNE